VRRRGAAVALLSGGLDSVVACALSHREGGVALAITFDYGQAARESEARAARAAARHMDVPWKLVALPWLRGLLPPEMSGRADPPRASRPDLDDPGRAAERARAVWVPNRNGVFVNVAAAFAEGMGCRRVVAGFNREEAAAFPDNSAEFMGRATAALALSTLSGVAVESPTAAWDKAEIVRRGIEVGAPLRLVWSCYRGGSRTAKMCGRCESCARLVRALETARAPREAWPVALAR
jgi:7-cyano-7-deazaguanine synthase